MTWAKVCDTLHGHPKARKAGLEAMGLWVMALSHCAAYLTDGYVSHDVALSLSGSRRALLRLTSRLVSASLWEPDGNGWRFHDYLDKNPTKDSVLSERSKKSEGGKKTASKRWAVAPAIAPAIGGAIGVRDAPDPDPIPNKDLSLKTDQSLGAQPYEVTPAAPSEPPPSADPRPSGFLRPVPLVGLEKEQWEKRKAEQLRAAEAWLKAGSQ